MGRLLDVQEELQLLIFFQCLKADSSKFGTNAPAIIAPLSKVTVIITDDKISTDYMNKLEEQGIDIHIAKTH